MATLPEPFMKDVKGLNENLIYLNKSLDNFSKSSNNVQERFIFWTKIMAVAIMVQAIAIGFQVYLTLFG